MRKPEFEDYWIIFLVCMLCVFFVLGCSMIKEDEVKTYPLDKEDPITQKLIELNVIDAE